MLRQKTKDGKLVQTQYRIKTADMIYVVTTYSDGKVEITEMLKE